MLLFLKYMQQIQYDTIQYFYARSEADEMASLIQRTVKKRKIWEN